MDTSLRRASIREVVDRDGYAKLNSLSELFGVAPVTIHRDLDYLVTEGVLERVRGGARSLSGLHHEIRTDFNLRRSQVIEQKRAIARRALDEIPDGATVFFDASTTVLELALELEQDASRSLTIVTNSPAIAFMLHAPYIRVIVTPGEVDQSLRAITGLWTAEFLGGLSLDTAFVSAAGLTVSGGLMTTQRELAEITKTVFARSERRIALVDSTKFDAPALLSMAPLGQLDLVITDAEMLSSVEKKYVDGGLPLVRAPGNAPSRGRQS
ncbi:DeoR/GlpR family DNA-binding transcription regulator [Cryobacterium tagatosivorans]|uniref:DeoR/GlpR transcriptional regulator n=1 Tax=Cryobacterium tagatosivorans TaxID=1259199 RepID=A0A4R8UJG7_9MICO|nr:DeoR/GlpR family DNA-binding transcription regulator [Cryobacterium tagatosivorans]TFB55974.1 DeoR/GlpR transcriptional regulator [Cryobacterium tagatosivorans]